MKKNYTYYVHLLITLLVTKVSHAKPLLNTSEIFSRQTHVLSKVFLFFVANFLLSQITFAQCGVTNDIIPGTISSSQTICSGDDPAAFSGTSATTSLGTSINYEWQKSTDNFSSASVIGPGGYGQNYDSGPLTETTWFRRRDISIGSPNCSAFTNIIVVTVDNTPPTAICQDIIVQLDGSGNATITEDAVNNGSFDSCGTLTFDTDITSFTCADIGANSVVLTVTDEDSNSSNCNATVTVEDNVAPSAVCQNITIQLNAAGNASIVAADIDGGSSDNCGSVTLSASKTAFTCADLGANNVTLTVDDGNGNSDSCTATVTVTDASTSASVSILSNPSDPSKICDSAPVMFTATPGGTYGTPAYQWQVNGSNVPGETSSTFTTSTLVNADTVTVIMTSNLFACGVVSNPITVTVNPTVTPWLLFNQTHHQFVLENRLFFLKTLYLMVVCLVHTIGG
jgi:hypothetical protein